MNEVGAQEWTGMARKLIAAIPASEHDAALSGVLGLLELSPRPADLQAFLELVPGFDEEDAKKNKYGLTFLRQLDYRVQQARKLLAAANAGGRYP